MLVGFGTGHNLGQINPEIINEDVHLGCSDGQPALDTTLQLGWAEHHILHWVQSAWERQTLQFYDHILDGSGAW